MTAPAALHSVYTLEGPDGVVRYVGVSKGAKKRLWCHYTAQKGTTLDVWLRSMRASGSIVTMRIVEKVGPCSLADAMVVERKWIAIHHDKGSPIFNKKPRRSECPWVIVDATRGAPTKAGVS